MDRLETWLHEQGLAKHADVLREAEVDLDVAPLLSEADLESLGLPLGARKRLLRAFRTLEEQPAPPPAAASSSQAPERRQLTVVFCQTAGVGELSQRLDAEDLAELLQAHQSLCAEVVTRHSGTVARYHDDGLLAYFGYPTAGENDAERAIRAALEMIDGARGIVVGGVTPPTRAGIATGPVVVGEVVGEGIAQEQAVVGTTPNLAARLQAQAAADMVLVAPHTRRLAGSLFEYADLGKIEVKGIEEPVGAWHALRERNIDSRFEAIHIGATLTPLIGREDELEVLQRRWDRARAGAGQAVTLVGEPGIGKSRLVQTLSDQITASSVVPIRLFCTPGYENSALAPISGFLRRAAGLETQDNENVQRDKLAYWAQQSGLVAEDAVPLLGNLLGVSAGDSYAELSDSPQRIRARTLDLLESHLTATARRAPTFMIFEDLHWADPSSLELLERVMANITDSQALLLLTARPEFQVLWSDLPHATTLMLNRLDSSQSARMIEETVERARLAPELVRRIAERADGVPLFAEELTRAVIESGELALTNEPGHEVPATLQDALMARLDRLGSAKDVAQAAATIGRSFSWELLDALLDLDSQLITGALETLERADLIRRRGYPPESNYTFKHGLLQEAAHSSQLRAARQARHQRIAQLLETRYPERVEQEPEVFAHHWGAAGDLQKSCHYSRSAGEQAVGRGAYPEAVQHFENALRALEALPADASRHRQEIQLRVTQGAALIATRGYAAPEVGATYARADELCSQVEDPALRFQVQYGLWLYYLVCSERAATERLANDLLTAGLASTDSNQRIAGHFAAGITACYRGQLATSRKHFDQLLDLYEPDQHLTHLLVFSDDLGLFAHTQTEWLEVMAGNTDSALAREQLVLKMASEADDPLSTTRAYIFATIRRHDIGDVAGTLEMADRAIESAEAHGFDMWAAIARFGRGWALALSGEITRGIQEIEIGRAFCEDCGQKLPLTYWTSMLAEVHLHAGNYAAGLEVIEDTLSMAETNVDSHWKPELLRIKGELLMASGQPAAAQMMMEQALELADHQEANLLALRAAFSLSRIHLHNGNQSQARDYLVPRLEPLAEGHDSPIVLEARAFANSLR